MPFREWRGRHSCLPSIEDRQECLSHHAIVKIISWSLPVEHRNFLTGKELRFRSESCDFFPARGPNVRFYYMEEVRKGRGWAEPRCDGLPGKSGVQHGVSMIPRLGYLRTPLLGAREVLGSSERHAGIASLLPFSVPLRSRGAPAVRVYSLGAIDGTSEKCVHDAEAVQ
jgi:hypothetical protein